MSWASKRAAPQRQAAQATTCGRNPGVNHICIMLVYRRRRPNIDYCHWLIIIAHEM